MLWVRIACAGVLMASVLTVYDGLNDLSRVLPGTDRYVTSEVSTPTVSAVTDENYTPEKGGRAQRLDRFGNRIDRAFGDYRVDPRGELFEWHSPNTAVSRLADPST